ncbi:hypothetical protein ACTFIZ_001313 [Dictyostelium cf. discoideum]
MNLVITDELKERAHWLKNLNIGLFTICRKFRRSAFYALHPPGHHAGHYGRISDTVHHGGNETQEIQSGNPFIPIHACGDKPQFVSHSSSLSTNTTPQQLQKQQHTSTSLLSSNSIDGNGIGNAYFTKRYHWKRKSFVLSIGPKSFPWFKSRFISCDLIQPSLDKVSNLHTFLIDSLNPTVQPLSLHEKIMCIFTTKLDILVIVRLQEVKVVLWRPQCKLFKKFTTAASTTSLNSINRNRLVVEVEKIVEMVIMV